MYSFSESVTVCCADNIPANRVENRNTKRHLTIKFIKLWYLYRQVPFTKFDDLLPACFQDLI